MICPCGSAHPGIMRHFCGITGNDGASATAHAINNTTRDTAGAAARRVVGLIAGIWSDAL